MTGFAAVSLADEAQDDPSRRWTGVARVVGPLWTQMPSLTVGLFGVQMLWSVEMSYASPYLLSLGLRKSLMAIVFLAGPLSGLIVQPMIGILADNSKSRFGRRRPFIFVCTALCALATLLFGFTRRFATIFTTLDSPANDALTIWLAILSIYLIDFSINAVQALDRALLVDTLPTSKQPAANAWAASMLAVGSVAGFFIGNIDLLYYFPFLGSAQLEALSVIAAFLLFSTHVWVCFHVRERILLSSPSGPKSFRQELKELRGTLMTLPGVIRQICWIQFFAWLGWFPVLFYSTVYIGDLHKRSSPIPQTYEAAMALDAESTRLGTRALFYNALVSLATNVVMPSFVVPQHAQHASSPLEPRRTTWLERVRMHLCNLWSLSHLIFATCMAATFVTSTVSGATVIMSITGFCWAMTQWAPFALLGEAILSHPFSGDASICLADARSMRGGRTGDGGHHAEETRRLFGVDDDDDEEGEAGELHGGPLASKLALNLDHDVFDSESDARGRMIGMGHARARVSRADISTPVYLDEAQGRGSGVVSKVEDGTGLSAQAGAIIGLHNLFIVIPQFLVTGLSSIIFALLDSDMSAIHGHHAGSARPGDANVQEGTRVLVPREDGGGARGTDSIAIIFRLGGVAAAIAFVLCYRLAKDLNHR